MREEEVAASPVPGPVALKVRVKFGLPVEVTLTHSLTHKSHSLALTHSHLASPPLPSPTTH